MSDLTLNINNLNFHMETIYKELCSLYNEDIASEMITNSVAWATMTDKEREAHTNEMNELAKGVLKTVNKALLF